MCASVEYLTASTLDAQDKPYKPYMLSEPRRFLGKVAACESGHTLL